MENTTFGINSVVRATILLLMAAFVAPVLAFAQPPDSLWSQTFGGSAEDHCYSVQQTSDGGYILVGHTESFGVGADDFWLVKTDASGTEEWSRTFGESSNDHCSSVQRTSDGGYILAGGTHNTVHWDCYVVKTDNLGNDLWIRSFGGSRDDYFTSGQQTSDGNYILAGITSSYGAGSCDAYLVKMDADGNQLWSHTYGGSRYDYCYFGQQTSDGGYVLMGFTKSFGVGTPSHSNFWLVKTDDNGTMQWDANFGGSSDDQCTSGQQTSDGGYILAGYTESFGAGGMDFYLVKTDANGTLQWEKTFGGGSREVCYSAQQTSDGGYILAGHTESFGAGGMDFYLVKTDANGDSLWSRTFGGVSGEACESIQQTSDGGYILAGATNSFGAGDYDMWLVKTGPERNQPPTAFIDDISPNPASQGEMVSFSGHGIDSDGTIVGCNWRSDIDGQLSAQASFNTSELSHGSHTIYFKVQDDSGAWSDEVTETLEIQRTTVAVMLYPTDDAYVNMKHPDDNYGSSQGMEVANRYSHPSLLKDWERNALLKFNLSPIHPPALISSATLYLYYYGYDATNPADRDLTLYRLTSDWKEELVTFDTQPSAALEPTYSAIVPSTWGWMHWDVTGDVQAFISRQEENAGWKIMDEDRWGWYEVPTTKFWTKEYGQFIPHLFIVLRENRPPTAFIDDIDPNPATQGDTVFFNGHGEDPDGPIAGYNWWSSIDEQLSTEASFSTCELSLGTHTIYFKVQDNNGAWSEEVSQTLEIESSSVRPDNGTAEFLPTKYALHQNYPNPFNPFTEISYSLARTERVSLRIFNLVGQEVAVLAGGVQSAGVHTICFEGSNLPSGVYVYTLVTDSHTASKKMVLMK